MKSFCQNRSINQQGENELKKIGLLLTSAALILSIVGCGGGNQAASTQQNASAGSDQTSAQPLKVTLPTWTGYGPLFLAQEKGFFKKHGVNVELSIIEGLAERKSALAGGKLDGMATALDVQTTLAASNVPMEVVWLLDQSYGGDGILAKKEISSPKDLKGKHVAFEVGSTSHMMLLTVLKQAGLTDKDITPVPMSAGDAGAAFVAGKVDAAVTWEPWLSKGANAGGKVLVSTKDLPGIIIDTVGFRKEVVDKRPNDVKAFVAAMSDAMDYWKQNKDESDQIMAKGLKIDTKEFTGTVTGLKFYSKDDNKNLFGTTSSKGSIYQSTKDAIDFYVGQKVITNAPSADQIVNQTFVDGL